MYELQYSIETFQLSFTMVEIFPSDAIIIFGFGLDFQYEKSIVCNYGVVMQVFECFSLLLRHCDLDGILKVNYLCTFSIT